MTERTYNSYVNADGLRWTFGRGEAELGRGGEYSFGGPQRVVEVEIVGTELRAFNDGTDPTTVLDWNVRLPKGAFLESGTFEVQVAFVGATATLAIGLVDANDMSYPLTDLDADGIATAAQVPVTNIDAVGDTVTMAGALIGTALSSDSGGYLISAEAGTANFTAGKGLLRLYYRMPTVIDTP